MMTLVGACFSFQIALKNSVLKMIQNYPIKLSSDKICMLLHYTRETQDGAAKRPVTL